MKRSYVLAALAGASALALASAASAACISCYTPATTPLGGTEVVLGHQGSTDVDIGVTDIAKIAATLPNSFSGTQTFADSGTWGPGGIAGTANVGLVVGGHLSWSGSPLYGVIGGSSGFSVLQLKESSTVYVTLGESGGAGYVVVGSGGIHGFSDSAFSRVTANETALGNGTPGDATGKLDLKNIVVSNQVTLPGNGVGGNVDTITTSLASLQGQQLLLGGGTTTPLGAVGLYTGAGLIGARSRRGPD